MLIGTMLFVSLFAFFFDRRIAARHPDSLWNWRSTFFSTLISVVLGLAVGLQLYEFGQKSAAANDRSRYVRLLGYELTAAEDILSDSGGGFVSIDGKKYPLLITHLEPVALEDAARSGLFTESVTENLMKLARILRVINIESQVALNLASSGGGDPVALTRLRLASQNLEKARTAGLECARSILEGIKSDPRNSRRVRFLEIYRP
jgi:hypothetical protein